jgi:hypothetical protein
MSASADNQRVVGQPVTSLSDLHRLMHITVILSPTKKKKKAMLIDNHMLVYALLYSQNAS